MRSTLVTCALLAAALAFGAAPAGAAPESDAVGFSATATETSAVVTVDAGSMVVDDGVFEIRATDGTVLAGTDWLSASTISCSPSPRRSPGARPR